eukprot:CAMPEP_0170556844 /NCGR_PEP_ID=MMETSP0211-20121228/18999_1 /TAXON_ID=311385 /ORGANISM="Pseudokeronopsis sp., Strain OXSARD2" /LENGTH=131 /DNA_ID=CAMNT_0010867421 /DNA_START=80 /DNA_END=476 /DNA_ORIENTATION=-
MTRALSLLPRLVSDSLHFIFLTMEDELVIYSVLSYKALSAILDLTDKFWPAESRIEEFLVILDHTEFSIELIIEVLLSVSEDISLFSEGGCGRHSPFIASDRSIDPQVIVEGSLPMGRLMKESEPPDEEEM